MNSRERLLAAITLKKTDRVPISTYELVGYNSRSFENNEPSYKDLMDTIREKTDCVCMWDPGSDYTAAHSSYPVPIDTRTYRGSGYTDTFSTMHTPKGELTSSRRVYDRVHTTWQTEHWCKTPDDVDKLFSIPFEPVTYDYSDYARICGEVGDHGIIMASVSDPSDLGMQMMEFGESMVWAMTETEHFAKTMEEIHRRGMINLENML